jgi:hypothetical protein
MWDSFLTEWITKVKLNINSGEVHPPVSHNKYPVDGVPVGVGLVWPVR